MLLAAALALAAVAAGDDAPAPRRQEGPLEKVLKEAGEKERPVLLDFHKTAEPACAWMDRATWSDPALVALLDGGLLVYRVEEGKGECEALVQRFHVRTWPTLLFLDSEGEELERQEGVVGRGGLLPTAQDVADGTHVRGLRARLEKRPDDPVLHGRLGIRLFLHGDPGGRVHLERALELDPKKGKESTREAVFLLEVQEARTGGSAGPLKAFLEKYPDCGVAMDIHRTLVQVLQRREDFPGQLPSLEVLLERSPDAEARNNLAWALAKSGREPERALALIEEALKESPESPAYLDTKAECLSRLGRHGEAVDVEKKAISLLTAGTQKAMRSQYESHLAEIEKRRDEATKR